ncbi:O-antigen ligase family protein [Thauera sinica]|uniref:O-antigen ligase family protein n=1 Tax=Thauera sinica TaxID=2665146 RepID=A0ABW1APA6_9RHOO|nr:O-antigen ligase family protein [Thauera sp. K11]ATE60532.1 hypothetical protein CCZ27_11765 [Thauera sp. K11]
MSILHIVFTSIPYLFAMSMGVLLPFLAVMFYSHFSLGVWAIASLFLLETLFRVLPGLPLGIVLYPADFVFILVGGAAILRLLLIGCRMEGARFWLGFGVVLLLSFAMGIVRNGTAAGVDFRVYFYFWAATLYAMTFPMTGEQVSRVIGIFAKIGLVIAGIVVYRWIVEGFDITELMPEFGSWSDAGFRVVIADQTLILAQLFLFITFFAFLHPSLASIRWLAGPLLLMVVVLQHRTVWLVLIVGVWAALFIPSIAKVRSKNAMVGVLLFGLLMVPVALSGKFGAVSESVGASAYRAATLSDTAGERLYSWQSLIGKVFGGGPLTIAIGEPFGSDNTRYSGDEFSAKKISYQAHNFYVQTLLRTGVLGLGLCVVSFIWLLRNLNRLRRDVEHGELARALMVLVVTQVVFYIPYGANYLQALLFGISFAYVNHIASRGRSADIEPEVSFSRG